MNLLLRKALSVATVCALLAGFTAPAFSTPLSPHAYAEQATDPVNCSSTTPNYGGYFSSQNVDDVTGGSASSFITKEMWVVMSGGNCNEWVETGSVDGALSGGYYNGSYWAINRSPDTKSLDYYEEAVTGGSYQTGSHTFEVQWAGSAWQVVEDGNIVKTITSMPSNATSAQAIQMGIEGSDSDVSFTSGTAATYLEYLAPDTTYSWYYWPSYYNTDSNTLGWSSNFTENVGSGGSLNNISVSHS